MEKEELRGICQAILAEWLEGLVAQHATPVMLIGLCQDHGEGKTVIITPKSVTEPQAAILLQKLVNDLTRKITLGGPH